MSTANTALTFTKIALCGASAIFTALFAASFAGFEIGAERSGGTFGTVSLAVIVGLALDSAKFGLWGRGREAFNFLALVLVAFSWAASVGFFLGQSERALNGAQSATAAQQAHAARIEAKRQRIAILERTAATNAGSEFHKRLDAAAQQAQALEQLNAELAALLEQSPAVGAAEAVKALPSAALFQTVAEATGTSFGAVRLSFYGLLALLIEVCALAAITATARPVAESPAPVSENRKIEISAPPAITATARPVAESPAPISENPKTETQPKPRGAVPFFSCAQMAEIRDAILSGRVAPVHRALKAAGFTNHEKRAAVIASLAENGHLEPGPRNSYRLVKVAASA